jgi:serine O-acetyltransferase
MTPVERPTDRSFLMRELRSRHPGVRDALLADARVTAMHRGERHEFRSGADAAIQILRLMWKSDAFLAQALYRVKARLQTVGVPVLPRLVHRLAMAIAQVSIGDPVVVHRGVYILHGQVVVDGMTEIHSGVVIGDLVGPTIERNVTIGTGAKVLGRLRVGAGAQIGANAVIIDDVGEGATAVGVPARPATGGT